MFILRQPAADIVAVAASRPDAADLRGPSAAVAPISWTSLARLPSLRRLVQRPGAGAAWPSVADARAPPPPSGHFALADLRQHPC